MPEAAGGTLIYTAAIGAQYRTLASLMARSLRRHGFAGDIAVLCDEPLDVPPEVAAQYLIGADRLRSLDMAGPNAVYLRTVADRFIPRFFRYEYLMHIDADVSGTAPLGMILEDPAFARRIGVQRYPRPLCTAAHDFTECDLRRVRDRERAGHFPFAACAGIVGFPGGRMGRDFFRLWSFEAAGRRGNDQSALNVVLHRAYPDNHTCLPGCTFWPDTSGCLCHYLGRRVEMRDHTAGCRPRLSGREMALPGSGIAPTHNPTASLTDSSMNEETKAAGPPPGCRYWSDCGTPAGGCCALSRFGGRPSLGTCTGCISRGENKPLGAGDTIAAALNATGVGPAAKKVIAAVTGKPCGCAKRQAALNRVMPYKS